MDAEAIEKVYNDEISLASIADCVMAGMARSGSVYALDIKPEVLTKAFENTVELLKREVVVEE